VSAALLGQWPAHAQHGHAPSPSHIDPALLAIDEAKYLGAPLPGDVELIAEDGRRLALGELFGKPLLLVLSYYGCDGSCPVMNRALAEAIARVQRFRPERDYRVLTLSFDAKDDLSALRQFASSLPIPPEARYGWYFTLAASRSAIERVTEAAGYRFFWSVRDRIFVHPAAIVVLSPAGRIARYLPAASIEARDVELALIEADWERVTQSARVLDLLAGACFSYSYKDGRYVLNIPLFVAAGSVTLGAALVILSFSWFGRLRRRSHA
jgi:protein SCO1/2